MLSLSSVELSKAVHVVNKYRDIMSFRRAYFSEAREKREDARRLHNEVISNYEIAKDKNLENLVKK